MILRKDYLKTLSYDLYMEEVEKIKKLDLYVYMYKDVQIVPFTKHEFDSIVNPYCSPYVWVYGWDGNEQRNLLFHFHIESSFIAADAKKRTEAEVEYYQEEFNELAGEIN